MCQLCDKLKTISTKHPIQFTCYWGDNNHNSSITSDLSKCTVEILDECGRPEISLPITRCPCCGKPIVFEQCETFEDITKREG